MRQAIMNCASELLMHILRDNDLSSLHPWIRAELSLPHALERGHRGSEVRRVQDWLGLNDFELELDGDFGPVTEHTLCLFQDSRNLRADGVVDQATFDALTLPMRAALSPPRVPGITLGQALSLVAKAHFAQRPREIGEDNEGPWVRLYMKGLNGREYPWCGGFATFCLEQATQLLGIPMPIPGSFGCDEIVGQAKGAGCFFPHNHARSRPVEVGGLYLRRSRTDDQDWRHVGIIVEVGNSDVYRTIEGNTNRRGSANGFKVLGRWRGYSEFHDYVLF